jgi:heterodisulfide reductase subunit A
MDESIAQAQAAAARAATILSAPSAHVSGLVAEINTARCTGCGLCVEVCPFQAIHLNEKSVAEINEALCKGCGPAPHRAAAGRHR